MISFGVISYGLASLGFLLLTTLLATSWEGRAQGARLITACAATSGWAALIAYAAWRQQMPVPLVTLAEFVRDGAWLFVLAGLVERAGLSVVLSRATYVLAGGGIALAAIPMIAELTGVSSRVASAVVLVYGGLLVALAVLVLIEQVFRNATPAGRYALKYFVIGVGVLFSYDLFLYSQAQLVNGVEAASWDARGLVNALVLPLITLGARNNPQWSLKVFVSRQVVFYTTTFLAVGAYLLIMALGGYLIRIYGGTWGRIAQLVFFAGAGAVLVSLVASASLRRRLRVFLSKHFYRNKYDYRVEWLRFIETLSVRDPEIGTRENAVRCVAQIVNSAGGLLYMAGEGIEAFVPVAGFPAGSFSVTRYPTVAAEDEMIGFLRRTQWVIDLVEYRRAPDFYQNLALPEFLHGQNRLRLVLPILQHDSLLGFVLLADPPSALRADLRGPRSLADRRAARRDAPGAARRRPQARREQAIRGLPSPDRIRDARSQESGGPAVADRRECGEAPAQPAVRRRRDRDDCQFDGADAAADRAAPGARGSKSASSRVPLRGGATGMSAVRGP